MTITMGTMELGNGETCPFDGCDFILGKDYDGDSFEHIKKNHADEAMSQLFPPKLITLQEAYENICLICEHGVIKDDELILRATALEPIKQIRECLKDLINSKGENK